MNAAAGAAKTAKKKSGGSAAALEAYARERGAWRARVFDAKKVAVDERVRLKCEIPLCPHYGHCLTCPPNAPSVEEFRRVLKKFRKALLIQTRSPLEGEMDRAAKEEVLAYMAAPGKQSHDKVSDEGVYAELNNMKVAAIKLHKIVNEVEGKAMAMGYHFATGLIGGECMLCAVCVGAKSGEKCRLPYQARPSMEAVGIDVHTTSARAGLGFALPPEKEIIWTGVVLLE